MQRDVRWLLAGLGLSASALAVNGCDSPQQKAGPTPSVTAVPVGSDGERIHPPEGKWCAKPDIAKGLVILGSPEVDGCPKFLDGARIPKEKELQPQYIDMPRSTYGFYNEILTKMRRSDINHAPLCCYNWREKTPGGRPLVEPTAPDIALVAPLLEGPADAPSRDLKLLSPPPQLREQVVSYWRLQAQLEHASVASFALARLELLALGAPKALLDAYVQAARDELRHAELALAVLRAWGAPESSFGPLELPERNPVNHASLSGARTALGRRTLDEAFEPEAAAALALYSAAERCACPTLCRILKEIAHDERRHAKLALDTARWCLTESSLSTNASVAANQRTPATHPLSEWGVIDTHGWGEARHTCRTLRAALVA